jgi:hypothetical protein
MKPTVFIQSNEEQFLGALVASHALRRNSRRKDEFMSASCITTIFLVACPGRPGISAGRGTSGVEG